MDHCVIISGRSVGGKSTLVAELARRHYAVIAEPGRRIIAEERSDSGRALPWVDLAAFARRAIALSLKERERARHLAGPVFFDRRLIDAVAALEHATSEPVLSIYAGARFHRLVFLAPPWANIYVPDAERRHGFKDVAEEYDRLLAAYTRLGYDIAVLPEVAVDMRADLVLQALGLA